MDSWQRSIDELQFVDLEVDRLAMLCGLSLLQPGVIEAVHRDERQICLVDNRSAWQSLRTLLSQRHPSVAGNIAPEATARAADLLRPDAHELGERMQPGLQ